MKRLIFFGTGSVCRGNRTKKGRTSVPSFLHFHFYPFHFHDSSPETQRGGERERGREKTSRSVETVRRGKNSTWTRGKRNMAGINTAAGGKCGTPSFV